MFWNNLICFYLTFFYIYWDPSAWFRLNIDTYWSRSPEIHFRLYRGFFSSWELFHVVYGPVFLCFSSLFSCSVPYCLWKRLLHSADNRSREAHELCSCMWSIRKFLFYRALDCKSLVNREIKTKINFKKPLEEDGSNLSSLWFNLYLFIDVKFEFRSRKDFFLKYLTHYCT